MTTPLLTRVVTEALVLVPKDKEGMEDQLAIMSWEGEDQTLKNSMTISASSLRTEVAESEMADDMRAFLRAILETPADRYIFMLESDPREDIRAPFLKP